MSNDGRALDRIALLEAALREAAQSLTTVSKAGSRNGDPGLSEECRKPVVIEPQTPEERRDKFLAHIEWLRSNTKMEVVELQPLRCKQCGGVAEETTA